jgi:uncharacterized membrane protein
VSKNKLKRIVHYFFGALIILYPLFVFSALVIFKISIRYLSILLIVLAVAYFFSNKHRYHGRHPAFVFISPAILFFIGTVCFILPFFLKSDELTERLLKIYPAMADVVYLVVLGTSLFIPPSLVYTTVTAFDKSLVQHIDKAYLERYCQKSTIIWCVYFVIDAVLLVISALYFSTEIWGIYAMGITYVIMAVIFFVEYGGIRVIEKKRILEKQKTGEVHENN